MVKSMKKDKINPNHYKTNGLECIALTEMLNFCMGNAMKYLWRCGDKEGESKSDDLKKALWYFKRERKRLVENNSVPNNAFATSQCFAFMDWYSFILKPVINSNEGLLERLYIDKLMYTPTKLSLLKVIDEIIEDLSKKTKCLND